MSKAGLIAGSIPVTSTNRKENMEELPCKTCICLALCKAKGPFKRWPAMSILYKKCDLLYQFLNENAPTNFLFENKRLYKTLDFLNTKVER